MLHIAFCILWGHWCWRTGKGAETKQQRSEGPERKRQWHLPRRAVRGRICRNFWWQNCQATSPGCRQLHASHMDIKTLCLGKVEGHSWRLGSCCWLQGDVAVFLAHAHCCRARGMIACVACARVRSASNPSCQIVALCQKGLLSFSTYWDSVLCKIAHHMVVGKLARAPCLAYSSAPEKNIH